MMANRRVLHVVSAQFPCGAAWLANVFIELDIAIEHLWGFDTRDEWQPMADGSLIYRATHLPWRQTLASLHPGRCMRPRTDWVARFSHEFPWQSAACDQVIVVSRDPRDALYSEWQRHRRNRGLAADVDLAAFVELPFESGPISQRDMLWLHGRCWQHLAEQRHVILLRFEDFKLQPHAVLRGLSERLQLALSDQTIADAIDASDVRRLQTIETVLADHDPAARQFNRRGEAFEWRHSYDWTWHRLFGRHWLPLLAAADYPLPPYVGQAVAEFDVAATLDWRALQDPLQLTHWRALIEHWLRQAPIAAGASASSSACERSAHAARAAAERHAGIASGAGPCDTTTSPTTAAAKATPA